MPDNSAAIAKIEAILNAGASTVSIDGTTVTYNFAELRRRLKELRQADPAFKRPRIGQIDLSNT